MEPPHVLGTVLVAEGIAVNAMDKVSVLVHLQSGGDKYEMNKMM